MMKNSQDTETRISDGYSDEEVHLRDYLRVILKRRWMIAMVFLVIVTTVTIRTLNMDPVYRATTQILIDKENPNVVNIEEVVGINAADRDYYQTQYEILKSKSVALKVIKDLDLKNSPEFAPKNGGFTLMGGLGSVLAWIKGVTSSAEDAENPADRKEENETQKGQKEYDKDNTMFYILNYRHINRHSRVPGSKVSSSEFRVLGFCKRH
jgi:uncharacterized protein involved in exopolysaccharide biosynthesis